MRSIFKFSIWLTILFFCIVKFSSASETRALSMGGTEYYTYDNTNIFIFPGSIFTYRDQVIAELRAEKDNRLYSIGINLPAGANGTVGIYLNRPLFISVPPGGEGLADNVSLDHSTSIFYGSRMTNADFGVGLTFGLDSYSHEEGSNKLNESAYYLGFSGGVSSDNYDVGIVLSRPAYNWEYENQKYSYSGLGFNLNGRYFTNKKGKLQFVPLGVFNYLSMTEEFDSGVSGVPKASTDYGVAQFAFGIGVNYQINPKNLFVMGVEGFGFTGAKVAETNGDENSITILTIPGVYVGVESNITSWLLGRFGGAYVSQKFTNTYKTKDGSETSESTYASQFKMTFGLGLKLGSFLLDASLNEGLLFEGPNVISGSNQTLSNRLSVTYQF